MYVPSLLVLQSESYCKVSSSCADLLAGTETSATTLSWVRLSQREELISSG
jgi:hypothetical protein